MCGSLYHHVVFIVVALVICTRSAQVIYQVDHGGKPWSKMPLLYRAVTDCQSPWQQSPALITSRQTFSQQERDLLGHYSSRFSCQRSISRVVDSQSPAVSINSTRDGNMRGETISDAHFSHSTQHITTTKNNFSGGTPTNFEDKNWEPR